MAVANTKSTQISNAEATPVVINEGGHVRGTVYRAGATVEVAAADDNNSVYRFVRIPSNAIVTSIKCFADAITGGTDYDLGLYKTAENGGAVVDVNCFADAVDLSSGLTGTELRYEIADINTINEKAYEVASVATDPKEEYDICLTGVTVGTGAGTISLEVMYTF